MKRIICFTSTILILFLGCENNEDSSNETTNGSTDIPITSHYGKVIEKIDAGTYSYLQINEDGTDYWIAVPSMQIEIGEQLYYSKYMKMKNFKSETLDRTFESVLFVDDAMKSTTKSKVSKE